MSIHSKDIAIIPIVTEEKENVKETNGEATVVTKEVVEAEEEKKNGSANKAKADQLEESLAKVPIKGKKKLSMKFV